MATHRYWRAKLLQAYDGGSEIELTEFWLLFEGSRVDSGATLTCDETPLAGPLANLSDDDTDTGAVLPVGATLTWDFDSSPVDVDDIRLGAADRRGGFLAAAEIAYSDDAVTWTPALNEPYERPVWYKWPGSRTLTTSVDDRNWTTDFILQYTLDPTDGRIASGSAGRMVRGSARRLTGVRQFEITRSVWATNCTTGVVRADKGVSVAGSSDAWVIRAVAGAKASLGSSFTIYPTGGWSASDVFGVVIDFVAGTMTVYKNGVSLGEAFSTLAGEVVRPYAEDAGGAAETVVLRTNDFAYPIAGAQPWTHPVIAADYRTVAPSPVFISNGGYAMGLETTRFVSPTRGRSNFHFDPNARGRIVGTVKRKDDPANVPLSRRVRLYRDRDGMLIAETWSDAAGNYQFDYIEEGDAYTALALDHQHFYRAVAADNLTLANGSITLIDD